MNYITSISEFKTSANLPYPPQSRVERLAAQLGKNTDLPNETRNFPIFNHLLVQNLLNEREKALPALTKIINTSKNEKQLCETLYTIDRMIEANVKGIKELYPVLSKLNNTDSANIQVLLAGIYRKTLVPDAFGPLMKMLIKNSVESKPEQASSFDPTEEIGGAILDYLRAKGAVHYYSQNQ